MRELTASDPHVYHPDYQINLQWMHHWVKDSQPEIPQAKFTDERIFGLRVRLFSSEHFKNNLLTFTVTFPPDHAHKATYANSVNVNQHCEAFKEECKKTLTAMCALTKRLWGDYKALPPPSFDTPPTSMKEAMGILQGRFKSYSGRAA